MNMLHLIGAAWDRRASLAATASDCFGAALL